MKFASERSIGDLDQHSPRLCVTHKHQKKCTDLPLCLDEHDEETIKQEGVKGVVTVRAKYEDGSQSSA